MPGGRIIRSERSNFKIGTTFSCSYIEPLNNTLHDKVAAVKVDALLNRMFLEPLLGLGYPVKGLPLLSRIYGFVKNGDEAKLSFDMDFVGIQNYTREMVTHAYFMPLLQAKIVKAQKTQCRNNTHELGSLSFRHILCFKKNMWL